MNYELKKLKKATILSCVKFTIIAIVFTLFFRYINKSFDSFVESEIVKAFIKTFKIPEYEVNLRNISILYPLIFLYAIFEIILNIIAYNSVKKSRNRFISFVFGLIKFCTLSCMSGLDYMFAKNLKNKEEVEMYEKNNKKEVFIGRRKENNNTNINTNTNTYERRVSKKIYPKATIKKRLGLRIFLAIILFPFYFIFPILNILIPIKIITGYKNKAWRFRKFTDMLREGMPIEQVDSIMYEFNYRDGYNRNNEYVRIYKTHFENENRKIKTDYEGITLYFDKNNQIIEMSDSYQRTV